MDTRWKNTDRDGVPGSGEETEYFVSSLARRDGPENPEARQTPGDPSGSGARTQGEPSSAAAEDGGGKGRRLKASIGFLAFFLGVTLTLGSLGAMGERLVSERGVLPEWTGSWQDTQVFRDEVSWYLLRFLTLAAGEELDWYGEEGEAMVTGAWVFREVLAAEDGPIQEVEDSAPAASPEDGPIQEVGDSAPAASPVDDPNADAAFRDDRNVLYSVWRDGKCLYQNQELTGGFTLRNLEGYHFYLTFRDGKAAIHRDGEALEVYGDSVYTGDPQWYVPGYDNFPAGEALEDAEVYMAVRETPVPYYRCGGDGVWSGESPMYRIFRLVEESRAFFLRQTALLGAGVLCLGVRLALRKEKMLADRKIAAWTGRVWGEVWALLCLPPLAWLLLARGWQELYWACRELLWSGDSLYHLEPLAGRVLYGGAVFLLSGLPALLALFWLGWLLRNRRRYNSKENRRSFLGSLLRNLRAVDLKRPVEKRLSRRTAVLGLCAFLMAAELIAFLVVFSLLDYEPLPYWSLWTLFLLPVLLAAAVMPVYLRRQHALARDLGKLADQVEAVRSGDLGRPLDLPEDADLRKTAEALNDIQSGMKSALAEQTRSERMKVELISNVSHDLKTPLTSILSYAELLRQEELPPAAADYARIIGEKAQRLKGMVQDVFEVSKAAADQLPVHIERLDLAKLLRQTLADLDGPIQRSGLIFKTDLPEAPVLIDADGGRLYRVFQNLIDNALRYALPGSRVYLTLREAEGRAHVRVRNTSRDELPEDADFTARFFRGDKSRTDGGSGLGLSIASSFTEACGGTFRVETLADLFTAQASFPLAEGEQEAAQ